MSSTQMLAQVVETTGATRADVLRVAIHGGTTQADWAIAYAIETITGRPAADIMWAAQDRLPEPHAVAPTNPHAQHDPEITVYPESTAPDSPNHASPHHPGDTTEAPTEQETLQIQVWAAVADITGATCDEIDHIIARWTSIGAIRHGITRLLAASHHPRARRLHATYVTAA